MKIFHSTIFFSTLIILAVTSVQEVYAQEAGSPSFELYNTDAANGTIVVSPRESTDNSKTPPKATIHPILQLDNTDSVVVRFQTSPGKTAAQKTQEKAKDDDDSILSFNFLYYLIERYKLQDIMD